MKSKVVLESCVESTAEAIHAEKKGANQLEICSRLDLGGLTPKFDVVQDILSNVNIPCKIMIRCREGGFYYTSHEVQTMLRDIQKFKSFKIAGFVFGALIKDQNNSVKLDLGTIYQLCKASSPYPVTIHKAIDLCDDILSSVESLKQISNVSFILSSGGTHNAMSGANILSRMQTIAGKNISIIAAGKITPSNLQILMDATGLNIFHGRKIV